MLYIQVTYLRYMLYVQVTSLRVYDVFASYISEGI